MDYNFNEIERKWQQYWKANDTYKVGIDHNRPKYYVLDMFPYPSGAGLHVGHPLGYIASDIYSRYKRLNGFNVLHPMGFDAYGLPAEQYAIQTGQHPAVTTEKNILRYKEQLERIGFSFDWSREVRTCDPKYYKWTQWTFIKLFESWYNKKTDRAESIDSLIAAFKETGNTGIEAAGPAVESFTAAEWNAMSENEQQQMLMNYRLAYLSETLVNWCPELGTVLANDEVSNGFSVRGGHPVERKMMRQWQLRITAYTQRLLEGLDTIDWSESIKEIQRNWIGRSEGAELSFTVTATNGEQLEIEVFTTRPDTIFGATYMVLAPEHALVEKITTAEKAISVEEYVKWAKNRSDRERMTEVKKVSGMFTGAYAVNPLNNKKIPVWIADYVLMGYGTGAIMAVPGHDSRDFAFARHFNLPIVQVVCGHGEEPSDPANWEGSYDAKEGVMINSGFINGMDVQDGISKTIEKIEEMGIGRGTINYRLRDAIFSRQRYWGEPFPVYYKDDMPYMLPEEELPLELPEVDAYLPTEAGDPPLARAKNWKTQEGWPLETNTMPGFAGSSAYYLRYMDPQNDEEYFSKEANEYWENVNLYIGGAEHATGHLIYARFWNKFLFDLGLVCKDEPFQKLINQGMIQGVSQMARILYYSPEKTEENLFGGVSSNSLNQPPFEVPEESNNVTTFILPANFPQMFVTEHLRHIPLEFVDEKTGVLSEQSLLELKKHYPLFEKDNYRIPNSDEVRSVIKPYYYDEFKSDWNDEWDSYFETGKVLLKPEVEKMSKSKFNVVNPDQLIEKYGADTLRLYEMFLGPLEQSKPWDTNGIEGVFRFIRKLWRLYHDHENNFVVSDEEPSPQELKILHRTIKKVREDIERFSFNTAVSSFMICVNELAEIKCNKRPVLQELAILISPYAPHLAEELWHQLGNAGSVCDATYPAHNEKYLVENTFEYPVSFNGKMRFKLDLPLDMPVPEIEQAVLNAEESEKWLGGNPPRKIIVVPRRIINVVV
ncbi:MAG: leucine--tRNA ligase [Bacteroidales bacterium]|nr:leucine--tRNA ligase [Bacteroidales bacterium]